LTNSLDDVLFNPEVDLDPVASVLLTVPVLDLESNVLAVVQLVASSASPMIHRIPGFDGQILFDQVGEWMAFNIAPSVQYLMDNIGSRGVRPQHQANLRRLPTPANMQKNSSFMEVSPFFVDSHSGSGAGAGQSAMSSGGCNAFSTKPGTDGPSSMTNSSPTPGRKRTGRSMLIRTASMESMKVPSPSLNGMKSNAGYEFGEVEALRKELVLAKEELNKKAAATVAAVPPRPASADNKVIDLQNQLAELDNELNVALNRIDELKHNHDQRTGILSQENTSLSQELVRAKMDVEKQMKVASEDRRAHV
jgi:hypothetical protein